MLLLLKKLHLIVLLLPQHRVLLLQLGLGQLDAGFQVLGPFEFFLLIPLFSLLLLNDIELGLYRRLSGLLFGGGKSFEFMRVPERIPVRCVRIQYIIHLIERLSELG